MRVQRQEFGKQFFSLNVNGHLLVIDAPHDADVREGDLLTLYTEVAIAIPQGTPKQ